jgi:hypothetical protein
MRLIDLRASMEYRCGRARRTICSTRALIRSAATDVYQLGLIANDRRIAALAAVDLRECGVEPLYVLNAPVTEASPHIPADSECIDFLFFASRRHDGDAEAARQYLAWETTLTGHLGPAEIETFNLKFDARRMPKSHAWRRMFRCVCSHVTNQHYCDQIVTEIG